MVEDRQMNNSQLTTIADTTPVNYNPGGATLLEMRSDSKRFPRIKNMSREDAVMGMSRIVSQAFLYRGQASDATNIRFIANALVDELLQDDKYGACYISLAEIQVVVKRAVLGGSEMFGISVASIFKVIMEYVKGEGHNLQMRVYESRKEDTASAVSPMLQSFAGAFIKANKINK